MNALEQKIKAWCSKANRPGLFNEQIKLFFNIFFAYGTLHQIRSGWSFGSKYMQNDTGMSNQDVGVINFVFLLFLGIGFEINGSLGDKKSPKHFVTLGMIGSSIAIILLAFSRLVGAKNLAVYCILQAANGYFESMCFPCLMRLLGVWFSQANRGLVVTLWSGGKNLGDIMGSIVGDMLILRMEISWYGTMFIFAIMCLISCGMIYAKAENNPGVKGYQINKRINQEKMIDNNNNVNNDNQRQDVEGQNNEQNRQNQQTPNMDLIDNSQSEQQKQSKKESDQVAEIDQIYGANHNNEQISNAQDNIQPENGGDEKLKTLTIKQALSIPGVPFFILGFMCLKSLNYGLIFWLPKYLQDNNLESYSSSIFVIWSIGVFIGGISGGILGDRFKKRSFLMPPSLLLLLLALFCFSQIPLNPSKAGLFMFVGFLMGAFQGIPYNIISGPLMIDLGKHPKLKGKAQAVGTIAGLIEGSGSLCSAVVQLIIPSIGEKNIFILFMLSCFASLISLMPVALNDYFAYLKEKKKEKKLQEAQEDQHKQQVQQSMNRSKNINYPEQKKQNFQNHESDSTSYKDSQDSEKQFKNNGDRNTQSINLPEDQKNPSLQLDLLKNQYEYDLQKNKNNNFMVEMKNFNNHHTNSIQANINQNEQNNNHQKEAQFISPSNAKYSDYNNEGDMFSDNQPASQLHNVAQNIFQSQQQQNNNHPHHHQNHHENHLNNHQQQNNFNNNNNNHFQNNNNFNNQEQDAQILDLEDNQSEGGESLN